MAAPRHEQPQVSRPRALLRTWIEPGSLPPDGSFRDRYMPGLAEFLERRGYEVNTIPVLAAFPASYREAWRRLERTNRRFIAPEAYLRTSDYKFAVREARRAARMPRGPIRIEDKDLTPLFDEERRRSAFDNGTLEALLWSRLPRRLADAGFEAALVVDLYENMIMEKPFQLGIRRDMPGARTVGFQHGALYPNLLCNFVTSGEAEFAPIPDSVVCNGEFFREVLVEAGLPSGRAVAGPALRYAHLWDNELALGVGRATDVLVPMPLVTENGVELLHKLIAALGDEDVRVCLKPHPMAGADAALRSSKIASLPGNFTFVEGEMADRLREAAVVVAIASSALYEALAAGVPVVAVGRESSLDLNPLGWEEGVATIRRSPDVIRADVLRLLELSEAERADYRVRATELLRRSFNPVSDETLAVFLKGLADPQPRT